MPNGAGLDRGHGGVGDSQAGVGVTWQQACLPGRPQREPALAEGDRVPAQLGPPTPCDDHDQDKTEQHDDDHRHRQRIMAILPDPRPRHSTRGGQDEQDGHHRIDESQAVPSLRRVPDAPIRIGQIGLERVGRVEE